MQQPTAVDGAGALGTMSCPSLDARQSGGTKLAKSGGKKLAKSAGACGAAMMVDDAMLACWVNPVAVHAFVSNPMTPSMLQPPRTASPSWASRSANPCVGAGGARV
jgi:hypothetical protein